MDSPRAGPRGVSEELRGFVEQMPYERRSILDFVSRVARSLPGGSVVLDVGAGRAPYRELFEHCDYRSTDWEQSVHDPDVDYVARADALPLGDASVDAVLLTQVLEHVPDPAAVMRETARVLRPGGGAHVTVPFVWELHEMPYDYWRYTPASLELLFAGAGFVDTVIEPRNDCFTTVAQLLRNLRSAMGPQPAGVNGSRSAHDDSEAQRTAAADLLDKVAERIAGLAPLDVGGILPLGWTASGHLGSDSGGHDVSLE